jgi:hypothetical protein
MNLLDDAVSLLPTSAICLSASVELVASLGRYQRTV